MQKTAAWPLAGIYAALIVYASLYPFDNWRSQGVDWTAFLLAPWPRYWTGFDVLANHGLQAKGPISVAQFTPKQIMAGFEVLNVPDVQAFVHVGTNLPVSAMTPAIETTFGKPLIGVNVATYWWALRRIGLKDALKGFGQLAERH